MLKLKKYEGKMDQEIVFTNQPETEIAVKELIGQLKNVPGKYDAVLFFCIFGL